MTRTKITYLAVMAVMLSPLEANAIPITRSYDFSANFGGAIAPDPAIGSITVTFDPDGGDVFGATTATLDFANFAVDGTIEFNFLTATDTIQIGSALNGLGGVFDNTNDFLLTLDEIASATPLFGPIPMFMAQAGFSQASSLRGAVSVAAPVPEPATLGLFGVGLAGMGLARRRKKV